MTAPGRPKGKFRSAQHEGTRVTAPGRPDGWGEDRDTPHKVALASPLSARGRAGR